MGARPSGAEAWLGYIAGNLTAWWAILGLSVLTDFLLLPVVLALYLALKGIDKSDAGSNGICWNVRCPGSGAHLDELRLRDRSQRLLRSSHGRRSEGGLRHGCNLPVFGSGIHPPVCLQLADPWCRDLITGLVMLKGISARARATWACLPASWQLFR